MSLRVLGVGTGEERGEGKSSSDLAFRCVEGGTHHKNEMGPKDFFSLLGDL